MSHIYEGPNSNVLHYNSQVVGGRDEFVVVSAQDQGFTGLSFICVYVRVYYCCVVYVCTCSLIQLLCICMCMYVCVYVAMVSCWSHSGSGLY